MNTLFLIAIIVVVLVSIASILLVKWHDKKIKETRERAISAGCPFFSNE